MGGNEWSEAAKGLDENASSMRKCKSDTGYSSLSLDGALSLLAGQTLTVPQIQLDLWSLNLSNESQRENPRPSSKLCGGRSASSSRLSQMHVKAARLSQNPEPLHGEIQSNLERFQGTLTPTVIHIYCKCVAFNAQENLLCPQN